MQIKNKILIIILTTSILFVGILIFKNIFESHSDIPDKVSIIQYKIGTSYKIKEITLDSEQEIKKIGKYIKKIKPLSEDQKVKLLLSKEIEIKYGDDILVEIQLEETGYCYYTNKKEKVSYMSRMPKGLYQMVKEKINY